MQQHDTRDHLIHAAAPHYHILYLSMHTTGYFSRGLRCSVAAVAGIPVTAEHGGEHSSDLVVATLTEKTCVDPTGVVGSMKALNVTSSEAAGAGNES
jgi:hypothetical protein